MRGRRSNYWADRGVTSFKAYMNITRAELKAAIDAAHKRGIKVTGHLCSVTYKEAAELGIDDLEHGFFVNTQLDTGKKPDVCSQAWATKRWSAWSRTSRSEGADQHLLVSHHVAITSTLPVFEETWCAGVRRCGSSARRDDPGGARGFLPARQPRPAQHRLRKIDPAKLFKRDMELERAFAPPVDCCSPALIPPER